jgi:serine/threonine protein kinase
MLELADRGDLFGLLHNEDDQSFSPGSGSPLAGLGSESSACRRVIRPVVAAVAHLHSIGIMHRDIKPENILVTDDGTSTKLADFGFAVNFTQHRAATRWGAAHAFCIQLTRLAPNKNPAKRKKQLKTCVA